MNLGLQYAVTTVTLVGRQHDAAVLISSGFGFGSVPVQSFIKITNQGFKRQLQAIVDKAAIATRLGLARLATVLY